MTIQKKTVGNPSKRMSRVVSLLSSSNIFAAKNMISVDVAHLGANFYMEHPYVCLSISKRFNNILI